jgi:hypothetical protein
MPYNKKRQIDPESDGEQQVVKKSKSEKSAKKGLAQGKDAEGNPYWEVGLLLARVSGSLLMFLQIGNNRRIGSSQFKGTTLVNIREYYTGTDGELKPGKKVRYLITRNEMRSD